MPTLIPFLCEHPGCNARTTGEWLCDQHRRQVGRERPSASKRGYGRMHQRWRRMVLHRFPICNLCKRAPSTVADHIVPLSQDGGWTLENGQGLCASCHGRKTAGEKY